MKSITVELTDPEFDFIQAYARQTQRQPQEVFREAVRKFFVSNPREKTQSLRDIKPVSVGTLLVPLNSREDLVGDMLDDRS